MSYPHILPEILYYRNCNVGDKKAIELAEILEHNTTIKFLGLRFNHIGNKGAIALAKMLEENAHLYKIRPRTLSPKERECFAYNCTTIHPKYKG